MEIAAAVPTVLALIVAVLAWLYPRSPNSGAAEEPVTNPALTQPHASSSPATSPAGPTGVPSADPSRSADDAALAYGRAELTISCGTGVDIDLDEPRVLPSSRKDLTYLCIDQEFVLSTDATGGYLNSAEPAGLDTCLEALRSSAFDETTTRISAGLSFCVATADQAHNTGKVVRIDALTDGWSGHVMIAVTAWRKPGAGT